MQNGGMEGACRRLLGGLASRRWLASAVLLILTAVAYVPGHFLLPPVDRTEVVYAESSREMLRSGRLIDPRYAGERERHRPIGTFWLQMASAKALGPAAEDRISTYRLPSLLMVTSVAVAMFWLLAPLVGGMAAFLAAGFAAVSPIVALESQLAITEGITLGLAVLAQLALLRLYVAGEGQRTGRLALLLWSCLGVSITLNALAVPLLSASTLIALAVLDRRRRPGPAAPEMAEAHTWWRRLHPIWGVPLMLALGASWPVCLVLAEGGWPYHGLTAREFLGAIGGSQAMKFRAPPLSFTLAFIAGSLPFVLMLWPALRRLWSERMQPVERFLLAWIAGYLAYLELISSKPALYTVPVLIPAAAVAVALALVHGSARSTTSSPPLDPASQRGGETAPPDVAELTFPTGFVAWPAWLAVAGWPLLVVALHCLTETALSPVTIAGAAVVMVALALGAWATQTRRAALWAVATIAGFAVFLGFTFGKLLPGLEKGWPTAMIAQAVEPLKACAKGDVLVAGYREPSAVFAFGANRVSGRLPGHGAELGKILAGAEIFVVETTNGNSPFPISDKPSACVRAVNFTRGCAQSFVVHARDEHGKRCEGPPAFACPDGKPRPVRNLPPCR